MLRTFIVSRASFSSILLMAKPTWINTQSPGPMPSGRTNATLTFRFTPETSTLAMEFASSTMSRILPGIPRHIICSFLETTRGAALDPATQEFVAGVLRAVRQLWLPDRDLSRHRWAGHVD